MNDTRSTVRRLQAENERLRATLERVKALHVIEEAVTARPWCASDKMLWPCPTTRALKEPTS